MCRGAVFAMTFMEGTGAWCLQGCGVCSDVRIGDRCMVFEGVRCLKGCKHMQRAQVPGVCRGASAFVVRKGVCFLVRLNAAQGWGR